MEVIQWSQGNSGKLRKVTRKDEEVFRSIELCPKDALDCYTSPPRGGKVYPEVEKCCRSEVEANYDYSYTTMTLRYRVAKQSTEGGTNHSLSL